MNKQLYNELIEAKGNGTLGTVLTEKMASLNIESEEDAKLFLECCNEKLAEDKKVSTLGRVLTGLSLAGIAAIPIGKMISEANKKKATYDKILASNPDLKTDPRTKDHYDMIWHVAPNLASNHIIASSVLHQLKAYDMIDHQMIAKLVEADKNMAESKSKSSVLTTTSNLAMTGKNLSHIANSASGIRER